MRMPAHQLFIDGSDDIIKTEFILFTGHLGIKNDMEKQIAQFILEVMHVRPLDRIGHLISLFDGIGRNAQKILLQIPWTA